MELVSNPTSRDTIGLRISISISSIIELPDHSDFGETFCCESLGVRMEEHYQW
jgi:hypothetical protein